MYNEDNYYDSLLFAHLEEKRPRKLLCNECCSEYMSDDVPSIEGRDVCPYCGEVLIDFPYESKEDMED